MGLNKDTPKDLVLATLAYHDLFDYPLTQKEIWKFLLLRPKKHLRGGRMDSSEVEEILKQLVNKKIIGCQQSFYFLLSRSSTPEESKATSGVKSSSAHHPRGVRMYSSGVNIVNLRKKREKYSQQKFKIAKKTANILQIIPFIKAISITGALAMNNSQEDDDIDFLIITSKNRLWLTRLFIIIFLEILGKRRRPKQKNIKDKICLNMFLDETVLQLNQDRQNLFTAHEIVQAKPILNKNKTWEKFLSANIWLKKYLPNSLLITPIPDTPEESKATSGAIKKFEKLAYQLQLKYMKSKQTREEVNLHSAFFHPKDRGKEILERFEKKLN